MTNDYGSPLLAALQEGASQSWREYVEHAFFRALGDGSLSQRAFQKYLIQDYAFLAHFGRAWALAIVKAETLEEMRIAAATVDRIINDEFSRHVEICLAHGVTEDELRRSTESLASVAFSRYVLDAGHQGDLLDLLATLAPCVFGYGEIGLTLAMDITGQETVNPYQSWIDGFAGDDYQGVCRNVAVLLEVAAAHRLGRHPRQSHRWSALQHRFDVASKLEAHFWNMCLEDDDA